MDGAAAGDVFVGYWDPFASLTDNTNLSFGLVDNLRVEAPAAAPSITVQPQNQAVKLSSNAVFSVTSAGSLPLAYAWRFSGTNLTGATSSAFTLTNVQAGNVGNYSVVITNVAGSVTSSTATLMLLPPQAAYFQSFGLLPDQRVHLVLTGEPGRTYLISTSTDLINWQSAASLVNTNGLLDFVDSPATNSARYYRAQLAP